MRQTPAPTRRVKTRAHAPYRHAPPSRPGMPPSKHPTACRAAQGGAGQCDAADATPRAAARPGGVRGSQQWRGCAAHLMVLSKLPDAMVALSGLNVTDASFPVWPWSTLTHSQLPLSHTLHGGVHGSCAYGPWGRGWKQRDAGVRCATCMYMCSTHAITHLMVMSCDPDTRVWPSGLMARHTSLPNSPSSTCVHTCEVASHTLRAWPRVERSGSQPKQPAHAPPPPAPPAPAPPARPSNTATPDSCVKGARRQLAPSGANATPITRAVWPWSSAWQVALAMSHNLCMGA